MEKQKTIASEVSLSGMGLHTGSLTTMTFKPAPQNTGIVFYRVDLPDAPAIPANIDHVVDVSRGTTIGVNGAKVHTVEHVLAALFGLDVDNIAIEIDGPEIPNCDGSSMPFLQALAKVELLEQNAERQYVHIVDPVFCRQDDVTLSILPADELRMTMTIAYDHVAIGTQYATLCITPEVFEKEIAPARTFCFLREVKMLQEQGLIRGGSLESAVVIGDESVLNDNLRFPDEFVRHKMLDLIGDMFLIGRRVKGHVISVKSGHAKNVLFAKQIKDAYLSRQPMHSAHFSPSAAPALDINMIMKVFPHRYPFLMVDRVLTYEPHRRAVAVKNVSVNEPFFQGHWPGAPVMPGVMIIEVMAQVGSVLLIDVDDAGNVGMPSHHAYLLGVDHVRFRRSAVPGDQIVIEAELIHERRNAMRVRTTARIDGELAAEAEIFFGIREATV